MVRRLFLLGCLVIVFLVLSYGGVAALTCEDTCENQADKVACFQEVQRACEERLMEISSRKVTLTNTVDLLNSKIALTQSQVNKTVVQIAALEKEIETLVGKISTLDVSLDQISRILTSRIQQSYKNSRIQPIYLLLTADGIDDFLATFKYLKIVQAQDRRSLLELEEARANFDVQKTVKEEKQQQVLGLQSQLLAQKNDLNKQQQEKQLFLTITKHEESRFQDLLAKARAELAAIQNIIAGKGEESQVGGINEGDKIASVIPAPSACSRGAHVHFEVVKDGAHQNPAAFLSSKSVVWDNAPDGQFAFSGSWPWPVNEPIRITQGYGMTFYAATLNYYGGGRHTGLDMVNTNDLSVKAVRKGTLYRGSIACGGGTLKYVRVDHSDDEYDTYYLH